MSITPVPLLDKYYDDTRKNSPLVYYRMREGTGTTMIDSSANANNGTYNGSGISWQTTPGVSSTQRVAASGKSTPIFNSHYLLYDTLANALTIPAMPFFDGAAGRATATLNSPAINTSAASKVTLEMWVKWDGVLAGANGTFEALANFGGATGLLLGFLKNGAADYRFGLSVRNTGDLWGISNANTLALLPRDVYNHIVFVIVNNAVQTSKLYINGALITMTQQIGTSTTTDSVTSAFALAYDGTASFFGGSIAEVSVYNGEPYDATGALNRYHQGAYGAEATETMTVPGIESRIELHGGGGVPTILKLNDKDAGLPNNRNRTLDQIFIDDIGGLDDADIRFAEESNFYRDGTNPLMTRYGGRTVTLGGYIEASNFNSMRQLQNKLKAGVAGTNWITLGAVEFPIVFRNIWNNGSDQVLNVRKNVGLQMEEKQDTYSPRRRFLMTLRSSYPHLESVGLRTDILTMGASLSIPNKGNAVTYPSIRFWGPFTDARLVLSGIQLKILGTVGLSSALDVDCKAKTCSNWALYDPTSDFPYIVGYGADVLDSFKSFASFVSVTGGTAGVTRVEITWRHGNL